MSQATLASKITLNLPWLYFTSLNTELPAVFLILLLKVFPVLRSKHKMFGWTVAFLSNIGLSLPDFWASLFSLPTKYPAANNPDIYINEFTMLSKCLNTSAAFGSKASASSRAELWRHTRGKQHPSRQNDRVFKPERSACRCCLVPYPVVYICAEWLWKSTKS